METEVRLYGRLFKSKNPSMFKGEALLDDIAEVFFLFFFLSSFSFLFFFFFFSLSFLNSPLRTLWKSSPTL